MENQNMQTKQIKYIATFYRNINENRIHETLIIIEEDNNKAYDKMIYWIKNTWKNANLNTLCIVPLNDAPVYKIQ